MPGTTGNPSYNFTYLDGSGGNQAFLGIDKTDSNKLKLSVGTSSFPTGSQLTIDPAASGNITLTPNSTGSVVISTLTAGALVTSSTGVVSTNNGSVNFVLTSNGPGAAPTFKSLPAGGVTSITGTANQVAVSSPTGAVTLSTPSAFIAPGSVTATTFINVPTTTGSSAGVYQINGGPVIQQFGTNNFFCGPQIRNYALSGQSNNLFGSRIGGNLDTGSYNTLVGDSACGSLQGATNLTGMGYLVLANAGAANDNACFGYSSAGNVEGSYNTAIGSLSLQSTVALNTCAHNIAIGYASGNKYGGSEAGNICIGAQGVTGDNNSTRIGYVNSTGTTSTQTTCFIDGITGVNIATAAVFVATTGQLGIVVSSERFKKNIKDMGSLSEDIMKLRPVTFNYKQDESKGMGLIAEEVYKIMPDLVNLDEEGKPHNVRYHDLPALLLNEIQKLNKRIEKLESMLA